MNSFVQIIYLVVLLFNDLIFIIIILREVITLFHKERWLLIRKWSAKRVILIDWPTDSSSQIIIMQAGEKN